MRGKTKRFTAPLEDGHKGAAVIVPFDPAIEWGADPTPVYSDVYGKEMPGHLVRGTMNGARFDGWIGRRWGRCFILVPDALAKAAGVATGDAVDVVVSLRPAPSAARGPTRKTRRPSPKKKRP